MRHDMNKSGEMQKNAVVMGYKLSSVAETNLPGKEWIRKGQTEVVKTFICHNILAWMYLIQDSVCLYIDQPVFYSYTRSDN